MVHPCSQTEVQVINNQHNVWCILNEFEDFHSGNLTVFSRIKSSRIVFFALYSKNNTQT